MNFKFKFSKIKILILGIIILLITVFIFNILINVSHEKNLKVFFLDVGQGDAIFIQTPLGHNIVIDGGPDNKIIKELDNYLPWWDKTIDLMILTHPHDDHVTGLNDVFKNYQVKKILYTGVIHNSPNFLSWLETIREEKTPLTLSVAPKSISLGNDCKMQILYPLENLRGKEVGNLNNSSIVLKLIFKNTSFLFAGDIEREIEELLIENYCLLEKIDDENFYCFPKDEEFNLNSNVFKANHHGSDTSNTKDFLQAVNPEIAVISVGKENKFNHPSLRIINRFMNMALRVYRTDLEGTILMESDGDFINIK